MNRLFYWFGFFWVLGIAQVHSIAQASDSAMDFDALSANGDARAFCSQIAGQAYICGVVDPSDGEKTLKFVQLRYVIDGEIQPDAYYFHRITRRHLNEACQRMGFKRFERASDVNYLPSPGGNMPSYTSREIERRYPTYRQFTSGMYMRNNRGVLRRFSCE